MECIAEVSQLQGGREKQDELEQFMLSSVERLSIAGALTVMRSRIYTSQSQQRLSGQASALPDHTRSKFDAPVSYRTWGPVHWFPCSPLQVWRFLHLHHSKCKFLYSGLPFAEKYDR